jgi:hypothetical protein
VSPATFEFTAARLVEGSFAATVIVIYRPGSVAVQSLFYELAAILNAVATHHERVFPHGDINIRCNRTDDPITMQSLDLIASYGFGVQPTDTTHSSGGTIDFVVTQDFVSVGQVSVSDVGLSDHHLL